MRIVWGVILAAFLLIASVPAVAVGAYWTTSGLW